MSPAELHLHLPCFFEMFYESCCHSGESIELIIRTRMILSVKGCYVIVTLGQRAYPEGPRQTRCHGHSPGLNCVPYRIHMVKAQEDLRM